ncbi:hypothetical protein TNCV_1259011 [Trichonephila clavipes]|nr:hypothetical protein TNCV_1259011 [Trichonephila clavipes]
MFSGSDLDSKFGLNAVIFCEEKMDAPAKKSRRFWDNYLPRKLRPREPSDYVNSWRRCRVKGSRPIVLRGRSMVAVALWLRSRLVAAMSCVRALAPLKTRRVEGLMHVKSALP